MIDTHNINNSLNPAVSWIMCAHILNEELNEAIKSCLNQSFNNFELLILVNGRDRSELYRELNQRFGFDRRVRIILTDIYFLPFSLSLGLHYARAPLIARMDADDLSDPDRLDKQFKFMQENSNIAVLGTAYEIIDGGNKILDLVRLPLDNNSIKKALTFSNPICHPSVMMRKEVIINSGGYLGGTNAEDYDLWSRISLNDDIKFANLSEPLLKYRSHGVGGSRRSRLSYASMASAQFRNFLLTGNAIWMFGAMYTALKILIPFKFFRSKNY